MILKQPWESFKFWNTLHITLRDKIILVTVLPLMSIFEFKKSKITEDLLIDIQRDLVQDINKGDLK